MIKIGGNPSLSSQHKTSCYIMLDTCPEKTLQLVQLRNLYSREASAGPEPWLKPSLTTLQSEATNRDQYTGTFQTAIGNVTDVHNHI